MLIASTVLDMSIIVSIIRYPWWLVLWAPSLFYSSSSAAASAPAVACTTCAANHAVSFTNSFFDCLSQEWTIYFPKGRNKGLIVASALTSSSLWRVNVLNWVQLIQLVHCNVKTLQKGQCSWKQLADMWTLTVWWWHQSDQEDSEMQKV